MRVALDLRLTPAGLSAAMQLAALFAVVTYFWRDVWRLGSGRSGAGGDYRLV